MLHLLLAVAAFIAATGSFLPDVVEVVEIQFLDK
jgi:hypothetical protein